MENYEKAQTLCEEEIEKQRNQPDLKQLIKLYNFQTNHYLYIGLCYLNMNKLDEAIQIMEKGY